MNSPGALLVRDLLEILEQIAPFDLAEPWDNVGLMVGDPGSTVKGVLVALDPTEETLAEAVAAGANVILTHHPLIFHPLRQIRLDQPLGRLIGAAVQQRLAVLSCHTNLDLVRGGVSDVLAAQLGLEQTVPLVPGSAGAGPKKEIGFGRLGCFPEPVASADFLERLLEVLGMATVQVAGPVPARIRQVAVCGGSGSDLAEAALAKGAQVYVAGEIKHSTARWAEAAGLCVIDGGHFATEKLVVPALGSLLRELLAQRGVKVPIQVHIQQSPLVPYARRGESLLLSKP